MWDDHGTVRLMLRSTALIDALVMKDILRALRRTDPIGGAPVVVQQEQLVRMTADAKFFLARVCTNDQRPVAYLAEDLPERIQGEFFLRFHKPVFPFRLFTSLDEAERWCASYCGLARSLR